MNRWKVAQHITSKVWLAWDDDDTKETPIRLMDRTVRSFRTHTEALAHADKMARTVEVTLPRDNTTVPLPETFEKEAKPITLTRWGEQIIIECTAQGVEEAIFIHDDELQPLALALLAHHYAQEQQ